MADQKRPGIAVVIASHPRNGGDGGPPPLPSPEDAGGNGQGTDDQECGNCCYFRPEKGLCYRYPPHGAQWPIVNEDDWCGEWMAGPQHNFQTDSPADEQQESQQTQQAPNPLVGSSQVAGG